MSARGAPDGLAWDGAYYPANSDNQIRVVPAVTDRTRWVVASVIGRQTDCVEFEKSTAASTDDLNEDSQVRGSGLWIFLLPAGYALWARSVTNQTVAGGVEVYDDLEHIEDTQLGG